jgi:hypothetical protein
MLRRKGEPAALLYLFIAGRGRLASKDRASAALSSKPLSFKISLLPVLSASVGVELISSLGYFLYVV